MGLYTLLLQTLEQSGEQTELSAVRAMLELEVSLSNATLTLSLCNATAPTDLINVVDPGAEAAEGFTRTDLPASGAYREIACGAAAQDFEQASKGGARRCETLQSSR